MAVLPQLLDVENYRPCDWDLKEDHQGRAYWVKLFCDHLALVLELISKEYPDADQQRLNAFRQDYLDTMRNLDGHPEQFETVDILRLTRLRNEVQNRHGFSDPFLGIKQSANDAALELLPQVLADLDALPPENLVTELAQGLMAGNLFDLGARSTAHLYRTGQGGFHQSLEILPTRPWFIDDLTFWRDRWTERPYRHAFMFVDNAGADICLGCIPFIRWMLRNKTCIMLAANSLPALNDVTAPELMALIPCIARLDPTIESALTQGTLKLIASGNDTPLLDLASISDQCAAAARDIDLLILHGMGRGIESNFTARFRCDVLTTAIIKDPAVAQYVGGQLNDCVLRLVPAAGQ
ncbi:MAG: ARMT1-like domain-containing protein [Planctomycetota bacterium]